MATKTRPPSPPNPQRKRTTFRPKATASSRESASQSVWKTVSKRTQRPPIPPRSKRALKGRSSGATTSAPIVVPPRVKAKDKSKSSMPRDEVALTPRSSVRRATKHGVKKKVPKGSVQGNIDSKDSEGVKRKIPPPPALPKRARRSLASKAEKPVESPPDGSRAYLKPTPKVKAAAASEGTSTLLKKKRGSTSKKAAQVSDMSAVKIEADYDPIQDWDGSQDPGVAELDATETQPDSQSEEDQESDQQEPDHDKPLERLQAVKSALQSHRKQMSNTNESANLREQESRVSDTSAPSAGGSRPARDKTIAVLALDTVSQQPLVYIDQLKSGRLPGHTVFMHGNRRAIELKILLHRQQHHLRIYQDRIEVVIT